MQKVLHEGKFMRLIAEGGWEYVQRGNCTGIVVIVAMTDDKKVILTKQYRPPIKKYCIEFPAGLVNDHLTHCFRHREVARLGRLRISAKPATLHLP